MPKGRLEAFSDGVLAIIITIMVLELRAPHSGELSALRPLAPTLISYVLSFVYIGLYWNNHHHFFHAVQRISGMALWGNLHLLFWLSLMPFVTSWMDDTHFATWPVVLYGGVLCMCALAWELERRIILRGHSPDSPLAKAVGRGRKEALSLLLYAGAIAIAFFAPWVAATIYALVAAIWFVPDRRIERHIEAKHA